MIVLSLGGPFWRFPLSCSFMALNDNDILFDSFEAFLIQYVAKYVIMIVQILSLIQKMQNSNLENPQMLDVYCLFNNKMF